MFPVSMAIFACVIAVGALVGVWLITFELRNGDERMDLIDLELLELRRLEKLIQSSTSTALRAEVDDLRGALDRVMSSHRKELGALWGRLGGRPNGRSEEALAHPAANDDAFEAMLALQSTPPVKPQ